METRVTRSPTVAASLLRKGGVVAFPTETVYGLGADVFSVAAVGNIFRAKGRPSDNPLIVHLGDLADLSSVIRRLPKSAERLMSRFFPGPLTLIMPRHPAVPLEVTAGLDTVGVRVPRHPIAQAFLRACGTPVAAPSANRSGRPSPTTWRAVHEEMNGRIAGILIGGATEVGLESTVVDCTVPRPIILREGAVTWEALREVAPEIRRTAQWSMGGETAKSPGLKYLHYAPTARVILVDGPGDIPMPDAPSSGYIGLAKPPGRMTLLRKQTCPGVAEYAKNLFHFFRVCEQSGARRIYCQRVPALGLGRALMDRLRRAAGDLPTGS
jgi:L-threonylcarbamoyladenylate synthase